MITIEEGKSYVDLNGHVRLAAYKRKHGSGGRLAYPWALTDPMGGEHYYTDCGVPLQTNHAGARLALEVDPAALTNTPRPGEPKATRDRAAMAVFKGDFSAPLDELSKLAAAPAGPLTAHTEPKTIRHKVLDAAKKAVAVRNEAYGTPEDNFERIARRWTVHLVNIGKLPINAFEIGFVISPADVALMLADVKVARIENDPKHVDSWIDIAGYAACGAECEKIAIDESPLSDK
ncbi:MAG: DUF6378 domain-containing protein [Hyphomicrobium sp.]|jgi:hypothetical protein